MTRRTSETPTSGSWGIDAPEREQTCQGKNGDVYECGRVSAAVLLELTRGRRVECAQRDTDRYGRLVAVCRTENGKMNGAMVRLRPACG
jgi:endonuclease YncB( thermonuclease family)